jgi:hypothetical protein
MFTRDMGAPSGLSRLDDAPNGKRGSIARGAAEPGRCAKARRGKTLETPRKVLAPAWRVHDARCDLHVD